MRRLRPRLTYANVMSSIAVFFAVGGSAAWAVNEWTGANIKDGTLTGADVRGSKDVDGSLTGLDVMHNSLKGADVDESSLGAVPNALQANSAALAAVATRAGSAATADNAANDNVLSAVVDEDGKLVRATQTSTSSAHHLGCFDACPETGKYIVDFARDVSKCTPMAMLIEGHSPVNIKVGPNTDVFDNNHANNDPNFNDDKNEVYVETRTRADGTLINRGFYLIVVC